MTIKTRYRDIPWEEAVKCGPSWRTTEANARRLWEEEQRGQEVNVKVPAYGPPERPDNTRCEGPFFLVADRHASVCPHIAEIGD